MKQIYVEAVLCVLAIFFLPSAGGQLATNKDEVEINGYHSDDCESVSSMASSIESHAIDDNNEGTVFDRHFSVEASSGLLPLFKGCTWRSWYSVLLEELDVMFLWDCIRIILILVLHFFS